MSILEWENLNKKARRLQSQLFNKLSTYEQIDGGDDVDHEIQGYEIERLLSQLDAVANTMTVTFDGTTSEWNQRMRIVREAHNSFSSDFYRQKKILRQTLARQELFGRRSHHDQHGGGSGQLRPRSAADQLMREQKSVYQSISIVDDLIGTASATHSALDEQKDRLSGTAKTLRLALNRFPVINQTVNSIARHKNRDMIVLSFVIAVCFFFTVVYKLTAG